jgi:hypothetical protein
MDPELIQQLINLFTTGQYVMGASVVIMIFVSLFKQRKLGGLVKKVPRRWRGAVPVVLGGIAGMLAAIAGGMSWEQAVYIGCISGPGAIFGHEVVVHALFGKKRGDD